MDYPTISIGIEDPDPRYTHDQDYSLDGNRPRLRPAGMPDAEDRSTPQKTAETGLTLIQPL